MIKTLKYSSRATDSGGRVLSGLLVSLLLPQALLASEFVNITDMEGCREITASAERLLCFDTVADGGIFNEQKLQEVQKENFGAEEQAAAVVSVDEVPVTIVRVTKNSAGVHYFYTEDGKAWKQNGSGRWSLKAPFTATIKKGLMGSFFLVPEGGKSQRVKRVK